jgi:anti-sigma factor RsiW
MQETPPHTLLEMKLLLSQYLDGLLEPEQVQAVDALLSQFPQYVEELQKLQKTREALQASLGAQALETPKLDAQSGKDTWKTISKRLKADQKNPSKVFDAEFVSAYYDGEIPAVDSEFIEFESQLYHNAEANELLAELGEVSEAVRQFGYRLETSCTLDISQNVMAAFMAEQGQAGLNPEMDEMSLSPEIELMSAYADQALTPREIIEANRLIEREPSAKLSLSQFNQISEQIASVSNQIQSQAPDLWPSVSEILKRTPEEGGLVVSIDRFKSLKRWGKIVGPVAAAVLLLVFAMPARQQPVQSVAQSVPVAQQQATVPVSYRSQVVDKAEIASVSPQEVEEKDLGFTLASASAEVPVAASSAVALRTSFRSRISPEMADPRPSKKVASRPPLQTMSDVPGTISAPAPSSEEYLFNALNEQMPGEDVSSILGK